MPACHSPVRYVRSYLSAWPPPRRAPPLAGCLHQPARHRALPDREPAQEGRHEATGLAWQHSAARAGAHRRQHQGQHALPHQDVRPAAHQVRQTLPRLQPGSGAQQRRHVTAHDGRPAGQDRGMDKSVPFVQLPISPTNSPFV